MAYNMIQTSLQVPSRFVEDVGDVIQTNWVPRSTYKPQNFNSAATETHRIQIVESPEKRMRVVGGLLAEATRSLYQRNSGTTPSLSWVTRQSLSSFCTLFFLQNSHPSSYVIFLRRSESSDWYVSSHRVRGSVVHRSGLRAPSGFYCWAKSRMSVVGGISERNVLPFLSINGAESSSPVEKS